MKRQALVVDDEPDILELLTMTLEGMSVDCVVAENLADAHQALSRQHFDLCFTDMRLPDGNGLDLVKSIQQSKPELPVAVITAHGSTDLAVQALKMGAFDFVSKPVKLRALRELVEAALKLPRYTAQPAERRSRDRLLGSTQAMRILRGKVTKLARSQAPIYIAGESGTGKELVARLIHDLGARASGPFVPINCGAIPADLFESELFGHKKGSFTGAVADKTGLFVQANRGTLFLDEVADLPMIMQVKLLRAIQEKTIRPVGGQEELDVDVRVLSATHKDLAECVRLGSFREDLFYRLNVIQLKVPALRERRADIPLLVSHILQQLAEKNRMPVATLHPAAMRALMDYAYPGNVRELENTLERAITWADGGKIHTKDLMLPEGGELPVVSEQHSAPGHQVTSATDFSAALVDNLDTHLETQEKKLIHQALENNRWNKTATAKQLGISFRALRYKLKKLGLD